MNKNKLKRMKQLRKILSKHLFAYDGQRSIHASNKMNHKNVPESFYKTYENCFWVEAIDEKFNALVNRGT